MFSISTSIIISLFGVSLIHCFNATAATINSASCASTAVQNAINLAANGDTISVPTGSCAWTDSVTISGKALTLQGAGIDQTNITANGFGGVALQAHVSATRFVTVTGFTFVRGSEGDDGMIQFSGISTEIGFRFHHNKVTYISVSRGVAVYNGYGLIDHNSFVFSGSRGSVQSVSIWGDDDGDDGGFTSWKRPLTLGTNNAVYIEDNTFTYSSQDEDSIDAYSGARLVIRHNNFNSISIGFHGTDTGSRRGVHSFEIYSNTFTNTAGKSIRVANLRGGTGVIYNNTFTGSAGWDDITLQNYRSSYEEPSSFGKCDGTRYMLLSLDLSDEGSRTACTSGSGCNVKFCSNARDTLCTSDAHCSGGTCSTYLDGSGPSGYPCRDQVGVTTNQVSSPLYVWNNGSVSAISSVGGTSTPEPTIMLNRDFFVDTAKPGYVAYTYPHPLTEVNPAPSPAPPRNLRVVP